MSFPNHWWNLLAFKRAWARLNGWRRPHHSELNWKRTRVKPVHGACIGHERVQPPKTPKACRVWGAQARGAITGFACWFSKDACAPVSQLCGSWPPRQPLVVPFMEFSPLWPLPHRTEVVPVATSSWHVRSGISYETTAPISDRSLSLPKRSLGGRQLPLVRTFRLPGESFATRQRARCRKLSLCAPVLNWIQETELGVK